MKTEKELNIDILDITMKIEEKFPELSKYLKEMPVEMASTASTEITTKSLKDYYDSLNDLFKNYTLYRGSALR